MTYSHSYLFQNYFLQVLTLCHTNFRNTVALRFIKILQFVFHSPEEISVHKHYKKVTGRFFIVCSVTGSTYKVYANFVKRYREQQTSTTVSTDSFQIYETLPRSPYFFSLRRCGFLFVFHISR